MKKVTPKQVEEAEKKLIGCPWCKVKPRIIIKDEEGNPKGYFFDDQAIEYLASPWSGLSFSLEHDYEQKGTSHCPIVTHPGEEIGAMHYYSLAALVKDWNTRKGMK